MKLGILLALVYAKTLPEVRDLGFDALLGDYKLLMLQGRAIGLVRDGAEAEGIWYRPAANECGYREVRGAWGPSIIKDTVELID